MENVSKKPIGLGWDKISDEDKEKIYRLIIDHTRKNHCCRVGWACHFILKQNVQENVLDKLAAKVVSNTEFIKESSNINFIYDWNITKNPSGNQYKKAVIIALIGVLVGSIPQILSIALKNNQPERQPIQVQMPNILIVHDTIYRCH